MWNLKEGELPGTKTYYDYDTLRTDIVEEYKKQNSQRLYGPRNTDGFDRFDPFTWDLHYAVELIENFGGEVPDIVDLNPNVINELDPEQYKLVPMRYDACLCESLLRCPNGTTSVRGAGSIFDCQKAADEILRRVMPARPDSPSWDRIENATDRSETHTGAEGEGMGTIPMFGFEVATFTMDLRKLEVNMTYDEHYQFGVYHDCIPCPIRYQCRPDDSGCIFPTEERQAEIGQMCYKEDDTGCCMCKRKRMPYYFEDRTNGLPEAFTPPTEYDFRFDMFPDNKHDIQQISVGALHNTTIVFVVELVHGLYYGSFAKTMYGIGTFNMFTPNRAVFSETCIEPCKYTGKHPYAESAVSWG